MFYGVTTTKENALILQANSAFVFFMSCLANKTFIIHEWISILADKKYLILKKKDKTPIAKNNLSVAKRPSYRIETLEKYVMELEIYNSKNTS